MKTRLFPTFAAVGLAILPSFSPLSAELQPSDWARFRGTDATGVASAATHPEKVPTTWSETENLIWKTDLPGPGSSSPILVGNQVFLTSFSGTPGRDLPGT